MKYGQQPSLGFIDDTTTPSIEDLDGRDCRENETGTFSMPLVGLLSSSAKLIPAFAMPQISVQLTIDSIAKIFTSNTGAVIPTGFVESQVSQRWRVGDGPRTAVRGSTIFLT